MFLLEWGAAPNPAAPRGVNPRYASSGKRRNRLVMGRYPKPSRKQSLLGRVARCLRIAGFAGVYPAAMRGVNPRYASSGKRRNRLVMGRCPKP